jgi:hypothetical protein
MPRAAELTRCSAAIEISPRDRDFSPLPAVADVSQERPREVACERDRTERAELQPQRALDLGEIQARERILELRRRRYARPLFVRGEALFDGRVGQAGQIANAKASLGGRAQQPQAGDVGSGITTCPTFGAPGTDRSVAPLPGADRVRGKPGQLHDRSERIVDVLFRPSRRFF